MSALHTAAEIGDVAGVRAALSSGVDVDICDDVCALPLLFWAMWISHKDF